jgi:hypothetical protein
MAIYSILHVYPVLQIRNFFVAASGKTKRCGSGSQTTYNKSKFGTGVWLLFRLLFREKRETSELSFSYVKFK